MKKNVFIFFIVFFFILFLKKFVIQFYLIEGTSMLPTLKHGDIVLVYKLFYTQKIGNFLVKIPGPLKINKKDIVLFETEEFKIVIKRVFDIQGEFYTLLGDNKETSYDSRQIGLIHNSKLRGKVLWIFRK